jgi:16S rRNA U516 pseudouridylate synthase RsuA-like enzyme
MQKYPESNEEIEYPIRLNRYLYLKGYCSRRQADKMIKDKEININGEPAVLGQKVKETDDVEISDRVAELPKNYEYYLFNKPQGVVSHNPQNGEKSVESSYTSSHSTCFKYNTIFVVIGNKTTSNNNLNM